MTHPVLEHWNEISQHPAPKVFRPQSETDLQQFLRSNSQSCMIAGNGSKWWLGNPPAPVESCIDMRSFNRVLEYSPGDLTVTVQAGISFAALQKELLQQNQTLPVDPPLAGQATLSGMIAVGISGPLQQLFGSLRDKVLGVKVMHSDGTITKAGGKVVKNVAGYDLCKLYTGSLGTLAIFLEVTLRVFPHPEETHSFAINIPDWRAAKEMFLAMRDLPVAPAGVVYTQSSGEPSQLIIRICGSRQSVRDQLSRLSMRFSGGEASQADLVASAFHSFYQNALPFWLRTDSLLSSITNVAQQVRQEASFDSLLLDFSSRRCHVALSSTSVEKLQRIRNNLRGMAAALIVEKAPLALKEQIDVWGSSREDLVLASKVRRALDPSGRLNPGRYVNAICD